MSEPNATMHNPYDVERFHRVAALIEANEDRFDMDVWAQMVTDPETNECKTSMCFAGFTCEEAGLEMIYRQHEIIEAIQDISWVRDETGGVERLPRRAMMLLAPELKNAAWPSHKMTEEHFDLYIALDNIFMSSAKTMSELWDAIERETRGMVTRDQR